MLKTLEKAEQYILYALIFLLPIFVISISPSPFAVPKLALLTFGVSLLLLIRVIKVIATGKLELMVSNFDIPVLLLALAYLASAILRTPNKMEAILLPGTATLFIGGALLYFLINQLKPEAKNTIVSVLLASASFFSLAIIFSFVGLFGKIPQLPLYMRVKTFTPEGGYLPAVIFFVVFLPAAISYLMKAQNSVKKAFSGIGIFVIVVGLLISLYNIRPGSPVVPRFPSFSATWSIAIDSMKESPIFGVGPANYLTAFNRFRPISMNSSDLWLIKFTTASNYYLTAFTEVGLFGLLALALLVFYVYKDAKALLKPEHSSTSKFSFTNNANLISLILLLLAFVFYPASPFLSILLFILLSLSAKTRQSVLNLKTFSPTAGESVQQKAVSRLPAFLITLPIIIVLVIYGYNAPRILRAEYTFNNALTALSKNDAKATYDGMLKAINLNQGVDRYRAAFSRVNLALANSIAGTSTGTLTDQDRNTIAQLTQQSIQEAKADVALNPLRSGNWIVLGQTYQALIPLTDNASGFAIQSFRQAVALDPINPNPRIALGGVYYANGDYETAISVFDLATVAKPDLANAHYNLAIAYKDDKQYDKAINEMTTVLSLLDRKSNDYKVAQQALEDIQQKKTAAAPSGSELQPPQEAQEPVIEPPITLPEGSEPPESPVSPTPTPQEESLLEGQENLQLSPTPTP